MAIGQFMPIIGDAPIPFSYEYNGSFSSGTAATTVTIPGVSFGRPSPKRVVVIGVGTRRSGTTSITAATIAGVAAEFRNSVGTNASAHLVWAALPSGALGDVVISLNSVSTAGVFIASYAIHNVTSPAPSTIGSAPSGSSNATRTTTGTTSEPSIIIAAAAGEPGTGSWSGDLLEDYSLSSEMTFSTASIQQTSAGSYSGSRSGVRAILSLGWS